MKLIYKDINDYGYYRVDEHIEVYNKKGEFIISADNIKEAKHEVFLIENPCYGCDCYDPDMGCSMPSIDKFYACPLEGGEEL